MKFSTGNQIKGKIMEIRKGAVTAIVYVAIAGDTMLEASVTIASLETLGLYEGKSVVLDGQSRRHHHRLRLAPSSASPESLAPSVCDLARPQC